MASVPPAWRALTVVRWLAVVLRDRMYNGYPAGETIRRTGGASKNGVHNIGALVGRGVVLDLARHRGVDHLQLTDEIAPAAVATWFKAHDLCALRADTVAVERLPSPDGRPIPLHVDIIRNLGGYLLEFVYLEELAADQVYEFLFLAAPLRLVNGIGSPITPLALY